MKMSRGMSLIEVLITLGLMALVSMITLTLISTMNSEVRALSEKLVVRDLENFTSRIFSSGTACGCHLKGNRLGLTNLQWQTPFPTTLQSGFSDPVGCTPTGTPFLQVGVPQPNAKSVVPKSVVLEDMQPMVGGTGQFTGKLKITMDAELLKVPVRRIELGLMVQVDPATGDFISCQTQDMTGAPNCREVTAAGPPPNYISNARCQPDEYAMSGGGSCQSPGGPLCGGNLLKGFLHFSRMDPDRKGWTADCYTASTPDACSEAYVICCKK